MDKGVPPSLFVNDGSFMERFKKLQQEKDKDKKSSAQEGPRPIKIVSASLTPNPTAKKSGVELKANDTRKTTHAVSTGKLAFSLKQKSKLAAPPVKLGADEDEDETGDGNVSGDVPTKRQKLGQPDDHEQASGQLGVAYTLVPINLVERDVHERIGISPPSPSDPTVKKVADKLASFVAKNGRQFEDVTRQKNPGDTPFQFLFDANCADYKYYEFRLSEEEKALSQNKESQPSRSGWSESQTSRSGGFSSLASKSSSGNQRSFQQQSNYQIPASALYEETGVSATSQTGSAGRAGESSAPAGTDPIAMMEYYMKKAAHEEKRRQPKQSKDEMPPPASLQGEGLGSSKKGIANPIMAGDVKMNNLGVGANNPGEVLPEDDIYEQYKKRMMLGYRHRPNPLGNPRKAYY
ncbi:hypothetical protein TIFTF001_023982 [Ficus carica]|uniref:SURP and G-patch domain-containing protein 1-like protein n=1 Tax=Ficus carica TaxID=3494 RepID=A0AA88ALE3_FICCA|nr:hypothetical protein TIFTF001_023982 [Ficus carica]